MAMEEMVLLSSAAMSSTRQLASYPGTEHMSTGVLLFSCTNNNNGIRLVLDQGWYLDCMTNTLAPRSNLKGPIFRFNSGPFIASSLFFSKSSPNDRDWYLKLIWHFLLQNILQVYNVHRIFFFSHTGIHNIIQNLNQVDLLPMSTSYAVVNSLKKIFF